MTKLTTTEKSLHISLYLIALQISKTQKPFEIGEELIKSCKLPATKAILGSKAAPGLEDVPHSNDTVQRRIVAYTWQSLLKNRLQRGTRNGYVLLFNLTNQVT